VIPNELAGDRRLRERITIQMMSPARAITTMTSRIGVMMPAASTPAPPVPPAMASARPSAAEVAAPTQLPADSAGCTRSRSIVVSSSPVTGPAEEPDR
jgi:hypothetical protein